MTTVSVSIVRTVIDVAAQRCGAAALHSSQHAELLEAEPGPVLFDEAFALRVDEVGHLHGGPFHSGRCLHRDRGN